VDFLRVRGYAVGMETILIALLKTAIGAAAIGVVGFLFIAPFI